MKKIRLATVWLDGCSGCHMSLLDTDEAIAVVAGKTNLVYGPLVDAQHFPEGVDITLVEGAVSNQDDLERIQTIRQRTRLLVALGDCAVNGNVPAMRNAVPVQKLLERVYVEGAQEQAQVPDGALPTLLRRAQPLHELVKVDLHVPGCPPPAKTILFVLGELLEGRVPDLGSRAKFG